MRKSVLGVMLLFAVQTASAAIQYEFRQTSSSDAGNPPATDCAGKALIDGERSRVEFVNCNTYAPGTVVLTTNGSRLLTFLDPGHKTFADVDAAAVATALGSARITISNKKVSNTEMPDHPVIAGVPTDHHRLALDYDITVTFGDLPLTETVHSVIDRWTTESFGDVSETFLSSGAMKTGNADLDELVSVENAKGKGFPMRQTIVTTTVNNRAQTVVSKLAVRRTVTITRDLTITAVGPVAKVATGTFVVPLGYHRADPLKDDTQKAPMQMLSMEPSGN